MFCEKCGKEYKDGAKFCSECGAYIGGGDEKEEIKASSVAYESVYLEKDEVLLGKMGKGFDALILNNQTTNEIGGLITNKRIYLKGRMNVYTIGQKNGMAVETEKVLNLEDIVSTEKVYMLSGYKGVLNACVFRLVVTLVCILAGAFWAEPFQLLGLAYFVL